jgi:hypothetical protein
VRGVTGLAGPAAGVTVSAQGRTSGHRERRGRHLELTGVPEGVLTLQANAALF